MSDRVADQRASAEPVRRESLLAGGAPVRADAVRNAARILEVASRLVEEYGAQGVSMDAVAEAAGVGKGTIFRRFESRAGLMAALMNHAETQFQQAVMTGPPPLGPGAPARDRLLAFGAARLDLVMGHGELMRARGDRSHQAQVPAFDVAATHVRVLLREARVEGDLELLAGHLVNALDPGWVQVLIEDRGLSVERVLAGWQDLALRVLGVSQDPT
jgi:AcrR family transcriptional regulator